ncbi:HAD family hydrolase [Mycolicibacterium sp. P9-64]|nr:HAD family hydrolase [Mycolicibacterium sp. P9-64]
MNANTAVGAETEVESVSSAPGRPSAVLFDIDGTLVDSNYLHVHAWCRAFADTGIEVESWRVHRSIGMDGSRLIESLAAEAKEWQRDRATELHAEYYKQMSPLLRLLPGARDLLELVDSRKLQVVLATSAPEDELSILRALLDSEDLFSAVTSSEDVDVAKPEPAIVEIALKRAGVDASHAVFVGDTVWDARASTTAGVTCIGVRSGGVSREELENAGAAMVFDNPEDMVRRFDESPLGSLPR